MKLAAIQMTSGADVAENLAIERACALFDFAFANVQPNSGSQANQGVFTALLQSILDSPVSPFISEVESSRLVKTCRTDTGKAG